MASTINYNPRYFPVCAICTHEIVPLQKVSLLNCGHKYHTGCLEPWFRANHDTCPLDKKKITSVNGVKEYALNVQEHPQEVLSSQEHPQEDLSSLYEARKRYEEARAAYECSRFPSVYSDDPLERMLAEDQAKAELAVAETNVKVAQAIWSAQKMAEEEANDFKKANEKEPVKDSVAVISNPSANSKNTVEREAAKLEAILLSLLNPPK